MQITKTWEMNWTSTVPVVVETLGLVNKGLEKYTTQIPGDRKVEELQKIVLLERDYILSRTLPIT